MIRYVCDNPYCLNTFLSEDLDRNKICEICGNRLIHFGHTKKFDLEHAEIRKETREELKIKYIMLMEKSFNEGLTQEECIKLGRCFRIFHRERNEILKSVPLWNQYDKYKFVLTENRLMKRVKIRKRKKNER